MSQPSLIQQKATLQVAGAVVSKGLVIDNDVNRIGVISHRNLNEQRVSGLVTILAGTNGRVLHEIPLGFTLSLWAYNRQHHHLYVNQSNEPVYTGAVESEPPGHITQIDLVTGQVLHTYTIGPRLGELFYCAPRNNLYFTYYNVASTSYMVSVIDGVTHNVRDIAALHWYPETISYIAETQNILLIGSHNVATLDPQGNIKLVYHTSPREGGIIYRERVGDLLYFTITNPGDSFFALSLPDYRYLKVLDTPDAYFQWIDPTREIAYFLARDTVAPMLSQCLLNEPGLQPIASLIDFPGYNDTMFFDSSSQRWYFDSSMSVTENKLRYQFTVIDLPELLRQQASAVTTIPLEEIIMGIEWWQPQRSLAILTSGNSQAHITLFTVPPK